jgi:predicted RNA-binding protein Jag
VILQGSTINPTMEAMINLEARAERVRQITEGNQSRVIGRDGDVLESTQFKIGSTSHERRGAQLGRPPDALC